MSSKLLILFAALPLFAQTWDTLQTLHPGDAIKIQELDGRQHNATFRSASPDAIVFLESKQETSLERAKVRRIQVRSGNRRVRNGVIGAAIGVAVGATIDNTLGTYLRNESGETSGARAATYLAPTAIFAGLGAAFPAYRTVYKK